MTLTQDQEIDLFVATKIGSFKHIKYHSDATKNSKKCIENLVDIKSLQKDDGITCMAWGNDEQTEILVAKQNQQIQVYNTQDGFTKSYTADFGTGHVVGLGRYKRKLLAAVSGGVVKLWSKKQEQVIQVGKIDKMRMCPDDNTLFATGGEENDLKVYRLGEAEPTFCAKNLPHDWLQLRRPVWVSDLTFLPNEGGNLLAVCSRHGYVRLYDTRAQRRPVCNVEFTMAATCMAPSFDERQVLVGFGRGQLHQVDLRKGKPDKGFKGSAGAITDITTVAEGRLIVSTSLDRQLRVHQYESKELVYKQYLTSKLTCVLAQTETTTPLRSVRSGAESTEAEAVAVAVEDDMDELFDNMETVSEKPRKTSEPEPEAKRAKPSEDDDAIFQLLRSTEKQKRKRDKKKKEKKAKSVFHNA
ncbi:WD repeat-containing protein 74-like isoform X2 [Ostrinia furnacalis]|uniref:WD repeat-containing protein 74-like isoform X1 n=1 Tax=Ostrinia furnacalis TaxID=93504 RepID=UPI00103B7BDF|nr:WD repeat-containing protein 74-like isoform X1 [Ostrinia furnacalis]XP_028161051.1 WD repeat-containing protein 74-like isoform X2 [Ostrinia furnacalis]